MIVAIVLGVVAGVVTGNPLIAIGVWIVWLVLTGLMTPRHE